MLDQYRVAAIQFEPQLGAKQQNVERLLELAETAAQGGARLIVLPEMATTGYCWHDRDEIRPYVEPIPGPTTAAFGELAQQYDCYIVVGMPELAPDTGIFYNSAALIGPHGIAGVYRKTHSFVSDVRWAKDGDLGLPVWQTPLGSIGILICMDAGYFEPARLLALAGADVLCFPTNWLGERGPGPAWIARAWENGCFLIGANRYGLERGVQFTGGSCVLSPDGTIQASQDTGDGIVYGEVALPATHQKRFGVLAARRPELYDNLTLNTYLWQPHEFHGLYGHRPLPAGRRSRVAAVQLTPYLGDPAANLGLIEAALANLNTAPVTTIDTVLGYRPTSRRINSRLGGLRGRRPRRRTLGRRPPRRGFNRRLGPSSKIHSREPDTQTIDLVVFPEYALTGCPGAGNTNIALDADDVPAWHERLAALARRYGLHLAVGYAEASTSLPGRPEASTSLPDRSERSGDAFFSAAVLVGPAGVVAHYRKTHVVGDETAWCSAGSEKPPFVDLPLGRVGLLLGSDLCFPEPARSLAIEGCDLLVVPAGPGLPPALGLPPTDRGSVEREPYHFHLARQRAFENNCYLAYAGLPYPDGCGASAIFGPGPPYRAGETLLDIRSTGMVVRTIDTHGSDPPALALANVRTKPLLRMRQTYLYDALQIRR